jgi:DNA polymerase III delta subunit
MSSESSVVAPLAYLWGEDAFRLEREARSWADRLAQQTGQPLDQWRVTAGDDADSAAAAGESAARRRGRLLDEVEQRLATAPLFGAGTIVTVRQPAMLVREAAARSRTLALLELVAPGNGLCFIDLTASGGKAAGGGTLLEAVRHAGGHVKEVLALSRDRMEAWLAERAAELDIRLGPGAARALAERVGAWVREADVDRRRQSELANGELEKLALYRPGGTVAREDVEALVAEAVPGSAWAFLDAIGYRRAAEAAGLAERLIDGGTPLQVLVAQLHRRLRELVVIRDHLASGSRPADLPRLLKLQPFRAQKLVEQARAWEQVELDQALRGLLEVDLISKGIGQDGGPRSISERSSRLSLVAWMAELVGRSARRSGRGASA